ncbi:hypothetical protein B6D52_03060 [Candidatus Parcubacteria bacterium 4484_255]|nr:MAG: hypothetical protein B6D52_03060 [Candidatus Parcubacteria bacterium 4484_255]
MYNINLPQFQGPFDLLLRLIKKEKLDITEIALVQVTNQFLDYIKKIEKIRPGELADFLNIAAKLILIKSKLLLPEQILDEDEEDSQDLVDQLKVYQEYASASREVGKLFSNPHYCFSKDKLFDKIVFAFNVPHNLNSQVLRKNFESFVFITKEQARLSLKSVKRRVFSLKSKINQMLSILSKNQQFIFNKIIKSKSKAEKSVMFMAILELMKRHKIEIDQKGLFQDITITSKSSLNKKM